MMVTNPGGRRDVGEGAVMVVPIQRAGMLAHPGARALDCSSIEDEQVDPAVVVVIDHRQPATDRFEQESLFTRFAAYHNGIDFGLAADLEKLRNFRRCSRRCQGGGEQAERRLDTAQPQRRKQRGR